MVEKPQTTTILKRKDGQEIVQTGTSGFTVTGKRIGNSVDVLFEYDEASPLELKAMVGMLLTALDELYGENFVTQCFNHYALETDKPRVRIGGRDKVEIHGYKDKPLTRKRR